MRKNLSKSKCAVIYTLSFLLENILVYEITNVVQRERWEGFFRIHALRIISIITFFWLRIQMFIAGRMKVLFARGSQLILRTLFFIGTRGHELHII